MFKSPPKKRTLYLTIVRSIFEHCSCIWAPSNEAIANKFEPFQKRCIKWILNEQFHSYGELVYLKKLHDLKIMPFSYKFMYTDLKLFFRVCHGLIPIILPDYVIKRDNTRSASNGAIVFGLDIDNMSSQKRLFTHSFFPRCVSHWNALPQDIRTAMSYSEFIRKLEAWIWNSLESRISEIDPEPD